MGRFLASPQQRAACALLAVEEDLLDVAAPGAGGGTAAGQAAELRAASAGCGHHGGSRYALAAFLHARGDADRARAAQRTRLLGGGGGENAAGGRDGGGSGAGGGGSEAEEDDFAAAVLRHRSAAETAAEARDLWQSAAGLAPAPLPPALAGRGGDGSGGGGVAAGAIAAGVLAGSSRHNAELDASVARMIGNWG